MSEAGFTFETAKKFFLDRENVRKATSRMNRRALSKIGAFLMTRARRLLRPAGKKGKVSKPGEPPRIHSPKKELKRGTLFVYVPETESVVMGTALLNGKVKNPDGPVPGKLEHGGKVRLDLIELSSGLVVPAKSKFGRTASGRKFSRTPRLEPRPYIGPAYEAEKPKFAKQFEGEFNNS